MVTTNVASYRPYDVTSFRSRDAAAAVLLANSLGWRVIPRGNGPVALVAEDGKQIRVPDNTGIKMDVFRGWVHQIAVHTNGVSITRGLIDQIVHQTKLNREHARLMYELAEDMPDDLGPVLEPEPPEITGMGEGEPFILTREPYKNAKGDETGIAYTRTWSNDHVDYECVLCGVAFDSAKGVASHRQWHIGRGDIPGKQIKRTPGKKVKKYGAAAKGKTKSKAVDVVPPPPDETMVTMSKDTATAAIEGLRVLEQIRSLLGSSAEIEQLTADLNHAHERIARLESDRKALREMLSE